MKIRIILLALISLLIVAYGFYDELKNNPLAEQSIKNNDVIELYDYYFSYTPKADNRIIVGDKNAPVSVAMVIDFISSDSREFYSRVMEQLMPYVEEGRVKLYFKYVLLPEDVESNSLVFQRVAFAFCSENPISAHKQAFEITEYNADEDCLSKVKASLTEDIQATKTFKLISPSLHVNVEGLDNTVLSGYFSTNKLDRIIRDKEISVGI